MNPRISVVVPSYNQADFLEATLRSILDQNYSNLELIVIDGGSTDNSVSIIEKYASQISYWVSEPDGGQTNGLIKGFKRSSGEIQCWINSDDLMAPGCLKEVASFFEKNPSAEAVFGNTTWIDRHGHFLREQREIGFHRPLWFYTYNYIPGMSMYWKRSLYEKAGGLNGSFNLAMDADLWARFSQHTKIRHLSHNWSFMRFYPEQKNRSLRTQSDAEDLIIRERHCGKNPAWLLQIKRRMAFAARITLKFVSGCYGFGRYQRHMSDSN